MSSSTDSSIKITQIVAKFDGLDDCNSHSGNSDRRYFSDMPKSTFLLMPLTSMSR